MWHENPYPKSTLNVDICHPSLAPVHDMAGLTAYKGTRDDFGCNLLGYPRLRGCADPPI